MKPDKQPTVDMMVEDHFVYYLFFPATTEAQEWLIARGLKYSDYFEGFFQLAPAAYDTTAEAQHVGFILE